MPEQVRAQDLVNKDVLEVLTKLKTELVGITDAYNKLMEATIKADGQLKKHVTTNKQLSENQQAVIRTTRQTADLEKENIRIQNEYNKALAKQALLKDADYQKKVQSLSQLKKENSEREKEIKGIKETSDAEAKRRGNIGKYKEDIVKAYVAIQAALMVAKAAFNVVNDAIKENETTSEFLERKVGGLGAAYDVLKSKLFGFVEGLIGADKSSIKWGDGFRSVLFTLSTGLSELIPGVRRLGSEMNNAAKETEQLIKVQQDLADLEGDRILKRSVANRQLSEARDLYTQEGISLQDKKKYLSDAIRLEKEETDKEIVYQNQLLDNLKKQGELKKKLKTYDVGREGLAIKQQEAKLNDLVTESISKQRKAKANLKAIDADIAKVNDVYAKQREMFIKGEQAMLAESDKEEEQRGIEAAKTMEAIDKAYYDARIKADEETQKRLDASYIRDREAFLREQEAKKQAIEETKMLQIDSINALADLGSAIGDRNIADLEFKKQKELDDAGDNAKKKEKIEADYAKKIGKIKQKQAIADKGMSLFNIFMSTRAAVMAIMAQLFVPFSVKTTQATWTKILGGIQAAAVLAAPLPKFFKGVNNLAKDTLGIVGDKAPGKSGDSFELIETPKNGMFLTPNKATEMLIPKGSTIHSHEKTIEKLKEMKPEIMDKLQTQRLTRKAIAEQVHNEWKIDENGLEFTRKRGNSVERYIDIYMRK